MGAIPYKLRFLAVFAIIVAATSPSHSAASNHDCNMTVITEKESEPQKCIRLQKFYQDGDSLATAKFNVKKCAESAGVVLFAESVGPGVPDDEIVRWQSPSPRRGQIFVCDGVHILFSTSSKDQPSPRCPPSPMGAATTIAERRKVADACSGFEQWTVRDPLKVSAVSTASLRTKTIVKEWIVPTSNQSGSFVWALDADGAPEPKNQPPTPLPISEPLRSDNEAPTTIVVVSAAAAGGAGYGLGRYITRLRETRKAVERARAASAATAKPRSSEVRLRL